MLFKDKEELAEFIQENIPIWVRSKRNTKTTLVPAFSSNNALKIVVDFLTDELWYKINQQSNTE